MKDNLTHDECTIIENVFLKTSSDDARVTVSLNRNLIEFLVKRYPSNSRSHSLRLALTELYKKEAVSDDVKKLIE